MLPPKHILSKTTFMYGCQCHKRLWLHKNRPKLKDKMSEQQSAIFQQGTNVGLLAQQLFPGGVDATPLNPWQYQLSVYDTQKYLRQGHQIIYEAAFQFEGMLCAVDLLVKTTKGWVAYEVKSSLSLRREHIQDAALQYFVISNSGLDLADMVVIHLNKNYIRQGGLELKKLFHPVTVLPNVKVMQQRIAERVAEFKSMLAVDAIPDIETGNHCMSPYPCDFLGFCHEKILTLPQEDTEVFNLKNVLRKFSEIELETSTFLFIASWRNAIPLADGQWPYRQIPFLWSIVKLDEIGGEILQDFILEDKLDNLENFINSLKQALPSEGKVIVANKKAVYYFLEDLKKDFAEEITFLKNLQSRLVSLSQDEDLDILDYISQGLAFDSLPLTTSFDISAAYFNLEPDTKQEENKEIINAVKEYGKAVVNVMQVLSIQSN